MRIHTRPNPSHHLPLEATCRALRHNSTQLHVNGVLLAATPLTRLVIVEYVPATSTTAAAPNTNLWPRTGLAASRPLPQIDAAAGNKNVSTTPLVAPMTAMSSPSDGIKLESINEPDRVTSVTLSQVPEAPQIATTSDTKHQSAPDQHGPQVEHGRQRVRGGVELRNAREMVTNNVEVAVPRLTCLPSGRCGNSRSQMMWFITLPLMT